MCHTFHILTDSPKWSSAFAREAADRLLGGCYDLLPD
jgi:hypothetical protein